VRGVVLNGSRANPNITPDEYQDFDFVFIVKDLKSFTKNHSWTNRFGEILICQLPNEMYLNEDEHPEETGFPYLMLFIDRNRIDLKLFPVEKFENDYKPDSLTSG